MDKPQGSQGPFHASGVTRLDQALVDFVAAVIEERELTTGRYEISMTVGVVADGDVLMGFDVTEVKLPPDVDGQPDLSAS